MHRKSSSTSAKKCLALLHEEKCLELRIKGDSYREIAEKVGMSHEGVSKALKRALEKHKESCIEKVEHHRIIELERLEEILRIWLPKAFGEKDDDGKEKAKPNGRAVELVLKTMKRKAELLGLDVPKTESLNVNAQGDIEQINIVLVKPKE